MAPTQGLLSGKHDLNAQIGDVSPTNILAPLCSLGGTYNRINAPPEAFATLPKQAAIVLPLSSSPGHVQWHAHNGVSTLLAAALETSAGLELHKLTKDIAQFRSDVSRQLMTLCDSLKPASDAEPQYYILNVQAGGEVHVDEELDIQTNCIEGMHCRERSANEQALESSPDPCASSESLRDAIPEPEDVSCLHVPTTSPPSCLDVLSCAILDDASSFSDEFGILRCADDETVQERSKAKESIDDEMELLADEIQMVAEGKRRAKKRRRRVTIVAETAKRQHTAWTKEENDEFVKLARASKRVSETGLRRVFAKEFGGRRTYNQCVSHLRNLRVQGKLTPSKDKALKFGPNRRCSRYY